MWEAVNDAVAHQRATNPVSPLSHNKTADVSQHVTRNFTTPDISSPFFLVVDTNFMVSHLDLVKEIRALLERQNLPKRAIVVPWVVVQELDGLKAKSSVTHLARAANTWIYETLANRNAWVVGQKLTEIEDLSLKGDDAILDCCRYFQTKYNALTVILSNDRNLCAKSLIHEVRTVSYAEGMTADQIVQVVSAEADRISGTHTVLPTHQNVGHAGEDAMDISADMDIDMMSDGGDTGEWSQDQETVTPGDIEKVEPEGPLMKKSKILHGPDDELTKASQSTNPIELELLTESIITSNLSECIDHQMNKLFDMAEQKYFKYSKDNIQSIRDVAEFVKRFSISALSDVVPISVLKRCEDRNPSFRQTIDNFGALWMYLSKGFQDTNQVKQTLKTLDERMEELQAKSNQGP
uniref:ARAD1B12408p n=1 Tax=Blastobotrys adeninivorans TaxID=409370 RepID=A0A060TBY3_BLAAD